MSLITGFIAGSLLVIWPWKDEIAARSPDGLILVKTAERDLEPRAGSLAEIKASRAPGEEIVLRGYQNWHLPDFSTRQTWAALGVMAAGVVLILIIEACGARPGQSREDDDPAGPSAPRES